MFYTGVSRQEDGLVQRIGLAISKDLINWRKYDGNPVLISDPNRYEQLDLELWHDQAWRDPWILKIPIQEVFYAYITTRVNHGPAGGRGVIAVAMSRDLISWEILDPVTIPGDYGHMEIPQVLPIDDMYYLLFSTTADVYSKRRVEGAIGQPVTGTHYMVSEHPSAIFESLSDDFLFGDTSGSHYGGKLIKLEDKQFMLLAMQHCDPHGNFIGELGDPIPVKFTRSGEILLQGMD
jgi:beta-fructofuranosidase